MKPTTVRSVHDKDEQEDEGNELRGKNLSPALVAQRPDHRRQQEHARHFSEEPPLLAEAKRLENPPDQLLRTRVPALRLRLVALQNKPKTRS